MHRLFWLLFPLLVGPRPVSAQPPQLWSEGIVILHNDDTLRGQVQVDLPGNRVLLKWPPQDVRSLPAVHVKYVGLEGPHAFHQRFSAFSQPGRSPLSEQIALQLRSHYISAPCDQTMLLFEVLETGPRVVLLYHPPAGTVGWRQTDPRSAPLRRDWFDPPTAGFYLGYLSTNRIVPFRCSLPGLLKVLPDRHDEVRQFAWQHPTLTVPEAITFYNSLEPTAYYHRREPGGR